VGARSSAPPNPQVALVYIVAVQAG
jgi:hypothetical protein